jgi:hypothetical protein
VSEPIRRIGPADTGAPPVPAVRRLTPQEREEAARERARKRRARPTGAPKGDAGRPPEGGGGSVDVRA